MDENTSISWTDDTFNPWIGCTKVSPACDGCYAEALMGMPGRYGPARVQWGAPGKGEGTRSRTADSTWAKVRKWQREAAADAAPQLLSTEPRKWPGGRFVFCASLADVFDNAVPTKWRRDLFDLIHECPDLTFLLLTKRPGMILKLFDAAYGREDGQSVGERAGNWPRNAAIGCTVVNQEEADRDIPKLLAAKAVLDPAFAFVSMEPLLGPVKLGPHPVGTIGGFHVAANFLGRGGLDFVTTGGETDQGDHKARPSNPAWFRSLRDECLTAGVPFDFKQWGEWLPEGQDGFDGRGLGPAAVKYWQAEADAGRVFDWGGVWSHKVGSKNDPCTLDGVLHRARPKVGQR